MKLGKTASNRDEAIVRTSALQHFDFNLVYTGLICGDHPGGTDEPSAAIVFMKSWQIYECNMCFLETALSPLLVTGFD
jgi:hypothetical protein